MAPKTPGTKRGRAGRPPKLGEAAAAVTGVRIPPEIIDALDALVAELNGDPQRLGKVTRSELIVRILRDGVAVWREKLSAPQAPRGVP